MPALSVAVTFNRRTTSTPPTVAVAYRDTSPLGITAE